jgi:acetyl-CoA/propionyl-CoA carboxylase biotin carboxyl carrier protein
MDGAVRGTEPFQREVKTVLVANRGEIAVRVIRACRAMGLRSVAVYSDADAEAPHVAAADTAVRIGPPEPAASYLNIPALLEAARRTRADAVHPGYGFLSENAAFAEACDDAGLTFVGPSAGVIAQMGSKTAARAAVRAAGVPVVPGDLPASQSDRDIEAAIARVGFPALLKASAGGGGKGMRLIVDDDRVVEALGAARREAERAFSDGTLYVERAIQPARHIEVQILADRYGATVHLFERDCSLQRRHQKVIEQAPAPNLAPRVRDELTRAAVQAARAVGYVNAGTIEFLLQGEGDAAQFYFLEMNTRLQVEHPITEAITGVDLVQLQLRIAAGEALGFAQADVKTNGHAIECRIYAEDSVRLLPQSGRLLRYRESSGDGIRVDSGVREGLTISGHYDPLLAKLIAHAATRDQALDRITAALECFEILGVRHNIAFLLALVQRNEVRGAAGVDTRFIERHLDALARHPTTDMLNAAAAAAAMLSSRGPAPTAPAVGSQAALDPWQTLGPIIW